MHIRPTTSDYALNHNLRRTDFHLSSDHTFQPNSKRATSIDYDYGNNNNTTTRRKEDCLRYVLRPFSIYFLSPFPLFLHFELFCLVEVKRTHRQSAWSNQPRWGREYSGWTLCVFECLVHLEWAHSVRVLLSFYVSSISLYLCESAHYLWFSP